MIESLVLNSVDVSGFDKYATIIGSNPSQGARSPKIWNAVYEIKTENIRMVPLDVVHDNLYKLLDTLEADPKFIGGAIAVPYKEEVYRWLQGRLSPEANKIGAVNCIYRSENGNLIGTNTDGEGALRSYIDSFGNPAGKNTLLLGTGGAAKAVAAFFNAQIGSEDKIWLCGRGEHGKEYARQIHANWISWEDLNSVLKDVDIIINCTSIGFGSQVDQSPLDSTQLDLVGKSTVVFDIVYQPLETELTKLAKSSNINVMNGLAMNLEQAVIAFQYVNPKISDANFIRETMKNV